MAKKQDDRTVAKEVREFLNQHTPLIPIFGAGVNLKVLQREQARIISGESIESDLEGYFKPYYKLAITPAYISKDLREVIFMASEDYIKRLLDTKEIYLENNHTKSCFESYIELLRVKCRYFIDSESLYFGDFPDHSIQRSLDQFYSLAMQRLNQSRLPEACLYLESIWERCELLDAGFRWRSQKGIFRCALCSDDAVASFGPKKTFNLCEDHAKQFVQSGKSIEDFYDEVSGYDPETKTSNYYLGVEGENLEIVRLYDIGYSCREIEELFDLSRTTVSKRIKSIGVPARERGFILGGGGYPSSHLCPHCFNGQKPTEKKRAIMKLLLTDDGHTRYLGQNDKDKLNSYIKSTQCKVCYTTWHHKR